MKTMNDMLRETVAILMLLLLPVLFGTVQAGAVTYGNVQKDPVQSTMYNVQGTMPQVGFRSTSAMPVSTSVGMSTLNEDGTVNAEAYGVGRANVGLRRTGNPGTPDDDEEEEGEQQPLGDALLPLMIFACAYLTIRATRKNIAKPIEP
jgi:hypothetical protein